MTLSKIRLFLSYAATYTSGLFLIGCTATQPTQYYMLTSLEDVRESTSSMSSASSVRVGLGPIKFPEYLDRPAIVLRRPGAEVVINDYHRWAEPLGKNFLRVLSGNLQMLLSNTSIAMFPWRSPRDIDYQVILQVARFDADINNNVQLSAHWTIQKRSDGKTLYAQKSIITREVTGTKDFAAIVEAQSKVIGILSHEIAAGLQKAIK